MSNSAIARPDILKGLSVAAWPCLAIMSFLLSFSFPVLALPASVAFGFCICRLTFGTQRSAFYSGLVVGTVVAGFELSFFRTVFGDGAIGLWMVLGLWLGLFAVISSLVLETFRTRGIWLLPVVWVGLEYFRSELYYLRFSWVTPGLSLVGSPWQFLLSIGQYGASGLILLLAVTAQRKPILSLALLAGLCGLPLLQTNQSKQQQGLSGPVIAGIQLEHPDPEIVPTHLDRTLQEVPTLDLIMLSEYTFDGPVPDSVRAWCRLNRRYLVVGGKDLLTDGDFRNTVFVVAPTGEVVFRQAKAVPIQFFRDGLPAEQQRLWESPWGPIGFAICYDMSYTRVIDPLIRNGARAILNPTMDPADWGAYEHELHARIPVARSLEYGIPVARLASSGVSTFIDAGGQVQSRGEFPGQRQIVSYQLVLGREPRVPMDRRLALCCTLSLPLLFVFIFAHRRRQHVDLTTILSEPSILSD